MLNKSFLLLVLITVTIAVTACSKTVITPKKALASVAFPKHPGTIKMLTMLDKSVEIISIDKISKWNQFAYYYKDNVRIVHSNNIDKAVKAIPIVEERMYSMGGGKLVPAKDATHLWVEKYDLKGKLLITSTLWRNGVRGGKQKAK